MSLGVSVTGSRAGGECGTAVRERPPFPFPATVSDEPIGAFLGDSARWSLESGVRETIGAFRVLTAAGKLGTTDVP